VKRTLLNLAVIICGFAGPILGQSEDVPPAPPQTSPADQSRPIEELARTTEPGSAEGLGVPGSSGGRAGPVRASDNTSQGRALFPHNWIRGYVDFGIAPYTDEPDLGRCAPWSGTVAGANSPCAAFARYRLAGYLEIHPIGRTILRRVFIYYNPNVFLGNNLPQLSYTLLLTPIANEYTAGVGIDLLKNLEVRVEAHRVDWLGRYQHNLGAADIGGSPLGPYMLVGVRWKFGGWDQAH